VRVLWRLLSATVVAYSGGAPGAAALDADPDHASAASAGAAVSSFALAVARLNTPPEPVTPVCFLASLPRPLEVVATTSVVSAQPAAGRERPRIFLLRPGLVVSVVSAGAGAALRELAEWTTPRWTEVALPIERLLALDAPLTRVRSSLGVTACGLCHRGEAPHGAIDGASCPTPPGPRRRRWSSSPRWARCTTPAPGGGVDAALRAVGRAVRLRGAPAGRLFGRCRALGAIGSGG
jgi:hypothetical protein